MSTERLGDLCLKIGSGATPRGGEEVYQSEGVAFIRSQNVSDDGFTQEGLVYIDTVHADQLANVTVVASDVLLNITGESVARVCQVPDDALPARVSQHVAIIRPQPDRLDAAFLRYTLASPVVQARLHALASAGATRRALTKHMISSLAIPLPVLGEQRAIAGVLGALDDKIELNRRMNETLAVTSALLYADQFEGGDQVGRELGDLADIIDCLHSKKPERQSTGQPLLQLRNIRDDGLIDLGDLYAITEADYALWTSRMEGREGDCVITNVGRVGAVAQIPPGVTAALGRNMTGVRCKEEYSYPTFVLEALLSRGMRAEIERRTDAGTILSALNVRSIPRLRLPSASHDVLGRFEKRARPLRARMELNLAESRTLADLRDALLPKLISGELRVRDAEAAVESAGG